MSISNTIAMVAASTTAGTWDLTSLLTNTANKSQIWIGLGCSLLGVICLGFFGWKVFKALTGDSQRTQTNWVQIIGLLIVGGMFINGGYTFLAGLAKGANTTLNELGTTTTNAIMSYFIK